MEPRRLWKLVWSYLPDWLLTICLGALFFFLEKIPGFRREFSLTDTSLQHTYAEKERVPTWLLAVFSFGVPLVVMPLANVLTIRSPWDLHNSILGLIFSLSLTGSITTIIKITVGRPRPDVINRCLPYPGSANAAIFGLSTSAICQQLDESILKDGWRSFPSGHSSLSFAGLGFLAFYLAGKLHLFDQRGHTPKAWLSLAPLMAAALIAISRTMDYRHHRSDVTIGSLLGATVAYFSYRQYFPSLADSLSHRPYGPRIAASPPVPFTKRYVQGKGILPHPVTAPHQGSAASSVAHGDTASLGHPMSSINGQGGNPAAGNYWQGKRKPVSRNDTALLQMGADEVVPRNATPLKEIWEEPQNNIGLQRPAPAAVV